jgi:glycosyltransferase involved in cell wall biosynthesis
MIEPGFCSGNRNEIKKSSKCLCLKYFFLVIDFNCKIWVEATIKSMQQQTYPNVEYIVIDGGSTDDSVAILKKYLTVITHWISEHDAGMYDTTNKGLQMVNGDYIHALNLDDVYYDASITGTGIMNEERKALLHSYGYYQHSFLKRTIWYYLLWIWYKTLNLPYRYKKR